MERRVTDILPPQKIREEKKEEKKEEKEIKTRKEEEQKPQLKGFDTETSTLPFKKIIIFSSILLLIVIGVFCYLTLSKAEIEIWPETDVLNVDTKLTVDKSAKEANISTKVIPGQFFQRDKTVSETFPATGKTTKEEKAEGTIKVYNAYSTSPQVLVATTRFVSADGKVFRTSAKVTIPGGTYDKGKLVPGEIDVRVIADQTGPEYNISPTTFSIPGFAGTDRYTKFYGKSSEAMSGGLKEEASKVTKEDLTLAEDTLTKMAKTGCEDLLKSDLQAEETSSVFDYFPDSIQTEITDKISLATSGAEVAEFKSQVKTTCKTLIFKKEDLNEFVLDSISAKVSSGEALYEESLKTDYSADTVNLESGKIVMSLNISGKVYNDVDVSGFKTALMGKSLLESKMFLEGQSKITKAVVNLWPFWVRSVPKNENKITFKIIVD